MSDKDKKKGKKGIKPGPSSLSLVFRDSAERDPARSEMKAEAKQMIAEMTKTLKDAAGPPEGVSQDAWKHDVVYQVRDRVTGKTTMVYDDVEYDKDGREKHHPLSADTIRELTDPKGDTELVQVFKNKPGGGLLPNKFLPEQYRIAGNDGPYPPEHKGGPKKDNTAVAKKDKPKSPGQGT